MIKKLVSIVCLLGLMGAAGAAEHPWSLTIDTMADSADAKSLYLSANIKLSDTNWLYLSGGAGAIESVFEDIDTNSATLGFTHDIGLHGSVSAYYDYWSDSTGLRSHQLQMPFYFGNDTVRMGLTPGYRRLTTDVLDPQSGLPREETFKDLQLGASLSFTPGDWRFYLSATQHKIEPDTDQYSSSTIGEELQQLGQLRVVAHLLREQNYAALNFYLQQNNLNGLRQLLINQGVDSFIQLLQYQARQVNYLTTVQTLAQGLSDDQWTVEIARSFGLSELSLEHSESTFVLGNLKSKSNTLRFLTPMGDRWDLLLQYGVTQAEGYEDITYYGVSFTRYF